MADDPILSELLQLRAQNAKLKAENERLRTAMRTGIGKALVPPYTKWEDIVAEPEPGALERVIGPYEEPKPKQEPEVNE